MAQGAYPTLPLDLRSRSVAVPHAPAAVPRREAPLDLGPVLSGLHPLDQSCHRIDIDTIEPFTAPRRQQMNADRGLVGGNRRRTKRRLRRR